MSNHISNIPSIGAVYAPVLVEHCRALLAEVESLTSERDAAFARGVAAMREKLAAVFDADVFPFSREVVRKAILALPDPEDK